MEEDRKEPLFISHQHPHKHGRGRGGGDDDDFILVKGELSEDSVREKRRVQNTRA